MKKSFFRLCSVAALVLLLFYPSIAMEGAKNGLLLWATIVLPTLLPFMICSNILVSADAILLLIFPVKKLLSNLFKLSNAGSYVLVSGLLCGYPMGARNCSDFIDEGRITAAEGHYLLSICNQVSPMFILGYTASLLPAEVPVWMLLCAVYFPILPMSWASRRYYGIYKISDSPALHNDSHRSFDDSLMDSCEVMVKIGGYIMLFSILAFYIAKFPINYPIGKSVLLGFVEVTTGIKAIAANFSGITGGFWIAAATAFGGFSGVFQTKSVIKNAGLSIRHYVVWKAIHSLLSILVFILLAYCRSHPEIG